MQGEMFIANLVLTLTVVTLAVTYLRGATKKVILELCHSDAGAEFWLKSADILAYTGSLMLVLLFGDFNDGNWMNTVRVTLVLTLAGLFFVVMFVSNNVWKSVLQVQKAQGEVK